MNSQPHTYRAGLRVAGVMAAAVVLSANVARATAETGISAAALTGGAPDPTERTHIVRSGTVTLAIDEATLAELGWDFVATGKVGPQHASNDVTFPIQALSTLAIKADARGTAHVVGGVVHTTGAVLITAAGARAAIGNPTMRIDAAGGWTVTSTLGDAGNERVVFELSSVLVDFDRASGRLLLAGELSAGPALAARLSSPEAAGAVVGVLAVNASTQRQEHVTVVDSRVPLDVSSQERAASTSQTGPDLIVADLQSIRFYGNNYEWNGAFAVGTTACNIGDVRANWIADTNEHPGIIQNMYRLMDDRFEQIGMSWFKHGFYAVSGTLCSGPGGCDGDPGGHHLGPGCSDPYSANLNGQTGNLGPRSDVNAHTGYFPYPWDAPPPAPLIGRRIQVHMFDLFPLLNPDALYFVEGQYVAADDAAAGNQNNNASYREMEITGTIGDLSLAVIGETARESPAIRAWQDHDPSVIETDIQVPGEGLFVLAAKATDLGDGLWHYDYALQNLNSDRAAGSFSLPIAPNATVQNLAFHDIDSHSGEPYDTTDWNAIVADGTIIWSTVPYETDPNANALRWGTLYNFRFDADAAPQASAATVGLFKPGALTSVDASTIGPAHPPPDCNSNGIDDPCDIDCGAQGGCDVPGCGESYDVDGNGVPDECDPDCNGNGVPDTLDIADGTSPDCSGNTVPDECEPDADEDGVVDECDLCPLDPLDDSDGDGVCYPEDQCPDDPDKADPGECGCGNPDTDFDSDWVIDCVDNCPAAFNPSQNDPDLDGLGTPCDNCPADANSNQADVDGDGAGDVCDPCPQENPDDVDGDGLCAPQDLCPLDADKVAPGVCGCGVADLDGDGDGAMDCVDLCPDDPNKAEPAVCGCSVPDTDGDGDTVPDCVDQCPAFDDTIDLDGNGTADCVENIPAVSQWGVVIMTLLLLTAGKVYFGRGPADRPIVSTP